MIIPIKCKLRTPAWLPELRRLGNFYISICSNLAWHSVGAYIFLIGEIKDKEINVSR